MRARPYVPESSRQLVRPEGRVDLSQLGIQFPWPVGSSWAFGGAHTNTGSGNYPLSSLDFGRWEGWGQNISQPVTSSSAGRIKVHSSCSVSVVMNDSWSTSYYHMDQIPFRTGDYVDVDTPIGRYANNRNQALCNGGHSTGPHLHWTLWEGGYQRHLGDVLSSGWTVHPGADSYDTNCSRMYLHRNGHKQCANNFTNNDGVSGDDDDDGDDSVCVGRCGQQVGSCYCDDLCASYNDCCPGKIAACGQAPVQHE